MKIISTNIGEARTVNWHGKEVVTGIFKYPVDEPIFLGIEDVENDNVVDRKYHGGIDKACYLYSANRYKYWETLYPDLELTWGMFGENLTVEGLFESEIALGDIFKIGEAVIQATQPRQPCFKLDIRFNSSELVKKFIHSGYSGVYIRVLEKGFVKTGDSMELLEKKDALSIKKIYELLYTTEFQKEALMKAINDPFIAESCKRDLFKKWGDQL